MAEITHLSPLGLPGRAYGAFAPKSGSHPVGLLTQVSPLGLPTRRYGSFAGKAFAGLFNLQTQAITSKGAVTLTADSVTFIVSASPHPVGIITQLSPLGLPSRRYGSFEGKIGTEFGLDAPAELNATGRVGTSATIAYGILKALGSRVLAAGGRTGISVQQIEYLEPGKHNLGAVSIGLGGRTTLAGTMYSQGLMAGDIQAIANAVWAHPKALTLGKWLALK